jgi:hypothetical protein
MITIATGYSEGFSLVGDHCAPIWHDYAIFHGYRFVCDRFMRDDKSSSWEKLWLIRKLLTSGHDQVFWVDADSVTVDMQLGLEDFRGDWYSAVDGYGLCNSHILCRRSTDVIQLLDTLLFLGDPKSFRLYHDQRKWEQDTLKDLMFTYDRVDRMVNFLPPELVQHGSVIMPGCLALHVPCLPLDERLAKLKSA